MALAKVSDRGDGADSLELVRESGKLVRLCARLVCSDFPLSSRVRVLFSFSLFLFVLFACLFCGLPRKAKLYWGEKGETGARKISSHGRQQQNKRTREGSPEREWEKSKGEH